ncbi:MAG: cobalamin B12-binding domain-containing protein [Peptostreptococcaceae bacterium]|jgi:methanogenic corrinoid protein MtbC1|nr:cobalamin B12-binding domain-containing protein [Peptostreptococcaceae bacterium]
MDFNYRFYEYINKHLRELSLEIIATQYHEIALKNLPEKFKEDYIRYSNENLKYLAMSIKYRNPRLYHIYLEHFAYKTRHRCASKDLVLKYFLSVKMVLDFRLGFIDIDYLQEILDKYLGEGVNNYLKSYHNNISEMDIYSKNFTNYLLELKRDKAKEYILDKLKYKIDLKEIYSFIIRPSIYELGVMLDNEQITIQKSRYIIDMLNDMINSLEKEEFRNIKRYSRNMVGICAGNEIHGMNMKMVCDFFDLSGWNAKYVGHNKNIDKVINLLKSKKPNFIIISANLITSIEYVINLIEKIRLVEDISDIMILVGGRVFDNCEGLWKNLKANHYVKDLYSVFEDVNYVIND